MQIPMGLPSPDKNSFPDFDTVICCPFHTNFNVVNGNKLKTYSSILQVKKVVLKAVNTALTFDAIALVLWVIYGS